MYIATVILCVLLVILLVILYAGPSILKFASGIMKFIWRIKLKKALYRKYGRPTKSIVLDWQYISNGLHVYAGTKTVILKGKQYSYGDILNCRFNDRTRIIPGAMTAITKTDTSDVVRRSLIGSIFGKEGAIIGGLTAESKTTFVKEDDTIEHDYSVDVFVNDTNCPAINFETKGNKKQAIKICDLISEIIADNPQ